MSKFDNLQDKALELAGQFGDGIRHVPDHAQKWIKAGMAMGAARVGGSALTRATRRNPTLVAAAAATAMAAAAGLLIYAARRRRQAGQASGEGATIEGKSRRVEARRAAPRKTAARRTTRRRAAAADSADS